MSIKEMKPITMAEAREILKGNDSERAKIADAFFKKFTKLSAGEAKKMFDSIKKLNLDKLKDEDIVKIIDFMPEDAENLRKIFTGSDITLEQDEITKILEIAKE
jgi:DNA-directed RNA polymerase subunit F